MPPRAAGSLVTETLLVALSLLLLAAYFTWRQWVEQRSREPGLSNEDIQHFRAKDLRRYAGSAVMTVMAVLVVVSTRINFRRGPAEGRLWAWIWMAVLGLLIVLLVLAFFDWRETTRYAVRHRRALLEEQRDYFASLRRDRRPRSGSNGQTSGSSPRRPSPD